RPHAQLAVVTAHLDVEPIGHDEAIVGAAPDRHDRARAAHHERRALDPHVVTGGSQAATDAGFERHLVDVTAGDLDRAVVDGDIDQVDAGRGHDLRDVLLFVGEQAHDVERPEGENGHRDDASEDDPELLHGDLLSSPTTAAPRARAGARARRAAGRAW